MKSRDNIIPIDSASKRASKDQSQSTINRVMTRTKRIVALVCIVLVLLVLGGIILLQGDNLAQATHWLESAESGLLIWRLALYAGAIFYGYKWLLTPAQQADPQSVKKTRLMIAAVAMAVEVLLVQKGLAGLAQVIHGGL